MVLRDPAILKATAQCSAAWGEIVSQSIVFTVPSVVLKSGGNLAERIAKLEQMVKDLAQFMKCKIVCPYHFIFDLNVKRALQIVDYPIRLSTDDADDLFVNPQQPTSATIHCLLLVALASLREGYFDELTGLAMATMSTWAVLLRTYGMTPPFEDPEALPPLFYELWAIHTRVSDKIIPTVLEDSQDPETDVQGGPQDRWIAFVTTLSEIGGANFASVCNKVWPVSVNVWTGLEALPQPKFSKAPG
jgi:hypothetical protein